ncbi:hypothetical protein CMO94_01370 [Candidatus Woesearchaeota archaeon]|jgi:glycosyltransferase involved in cell wall biosynthesis|nr:hypothetical protein [Candidatus Woesearchaeota archaeon]
MGKNKILVLATTFPRWKNDTTPRFVYDLSDKLTRNYNVIALAPHHKGSKKKEVMGRLQVRRFVYFKPESLQKLCYEGGMIPNMKNSFLAKIQMPLLIISELLSSYRLVKEEHINMIHAHWILPQGFVGVFLKKLFKIPLLVTVHGSDLFPLKNMLFKRLQIFVVKNADSVTVNSNATKNELVRRFPSYSSKISVIPMGIDINRFKERSIKKPKKYSGNSILLFVGRLSDQKGLQFLISSMPDVLKHYPNIKLLVIGEGPYLDKLKDSAGANRISDNVEFLGSMSNSEIAKYYNFADIFIIPSLSTKTGTEALGLSLLEAMASGCTVIGTKVGGIPFVIKNSYNGMLVKQKDSKELANAVITLLKNNQKSKKLGKNAAEFVRKNYSWDKISKEFIKIYKNLLK